jgi:glycoprotein 3-alpha-L-fucosyltransferase
MYFIVRVFDRHDVVPIVMGAPPEDYAAILPPHSFIHVDDFRSPEDLAKYIYALDANDTLYNEYFQWKRYLKIVNPYPDQWCRLCGLLHAALDSQSPYVHWYTDYAKWWEGACNARWTNGRKWQTWKQ